MLPCEKVCLRQLKNVTRVQCIYLGGCVTNEACQHHAAYRPDIGAGAVRSARENFAIKGHVNRFVLHTEAQLTERCIHLSADMLR